MLMDIYVLAPERTVAMVNRFLTQYLPNGERADADYAVHLGGAREPTLFFDTPGELTAYCEAYPDAEARAYWNNPSDGDPHSAHVFFLPAGGLILGLSVCSRVLDETGRIWDEWLEELRSFAGATVLDWRVPARGHDCGIHRGREPIPFSLMKRWH